MPKVSVHTKTAKDSDDWKKASREFLRLPIVGEYIALESMLAWYHVELVVHCPFEADFVAEIYAIRVDRTEVLVAATK